MLHKCFVFVGSTVLGSLIVAPCLAILILSALYPTETTRIFFGCIVAAFTFLVGHTAGSCLGWWMALGEGGSATVTKRTGKK